MTTAHKIWQVGTTQLLLIIACHLFLGWFAMPVMEMHDKTEPFAAENDSDRKVILLLIDALREDFVEFDTNTHLYLDPEAPYAYRG